MFQARNTLNMIYGTPPGLAVLPDGETEIALARATTIKRAVFLALIRKRLRIRNPQPKKRED